MTSSDRADSIRAGREAFRLQAWKQAFGRLSAADAEAPLEPEDVERLASAAHLLGHESQSNELLIRAHRGFLDAGDSQRAARAAFWLGFALLNRGEAAQSSGWLARAERLLDDAGLECSERGYLLLPVARRHMLSGNFAAAYDAFSSAALVGTRFDDRDLIAFARHGMGRVILQRGDIQRGTALLDEAMVAVLAGEVTPLLAGIIYCSVLDACTQVFDVGRAREWTAALADWCAAQPDMVPFRGECQIRRAELLQLKGDWAGALEAAKRVEAGPASWSLADAWYRIAEIHRLRGELDEAETGYARAGERGRKPYPGLALLRLAERQTEAAATAIRRATLEARNDRERAQLLSASVEILLAASDITGARAAADELSQLRARLEAPAPMLDALSGETSGAVLLAAGDAEGAMVELRQAMTRWRELEAPYEEARVRVLLARACRMLGDHDNTTIELAAARRVFEGLGAATDLARVQSLVATPKPDPVASFTSREVEVLRLLASGRTNRAIAGQLGISEKTVARHVSNIFAKLGLGSRAAATAFAYESGIASTST